MGLEMLWVSLVEIGPSWGSEKEHENLRKSFFYANKGLYGALSPTGLIAHNDKAITKIYCVTIIS